MAEPQVDIDELKRRLRRLKKLEMKIRPNNYSRLIWDEFFDLQDLGNKKARYALHRLSAMSKVEIKDVISEYFYHVYYQAYKENGISDAQAYQPDILTQLGLNYDADIDAVKKRFRELAKKYHPDVGGDSEKFIDLMENYRKLIDK